MTKIWIFPILFEIDVFHGTDRTVSACKLTGNLEGGGGEISSPGVRNKQKLFSVMPSVLRILPPFIFLRSELEFCGTRTDAPSPLMNVTGGFSSTRCYLNGQKQAETGNASSNERPPGLLKTL